MQMKITQATYPTENTFQMEVIFLKLNSWPYFQGEALRLDTTNSSETTLNV